MGFFSCSSCLAVLERTDDKAAFYKLGAQCELNGCGFCVNLTIKPCKLPILNLVQNQPVVVSSIFKQVTSWPCSIRIPSNIPHHPNFLDHTNPFICLTLPIQLIVRGGLGKQLIGFRGASEKASLRFIKAACPHKLFKKIQLFWEVDTSKLIGLLKQLIFFPSSLRKPRLGDGG